MHTVGIFILAAEEGAQGGNALGFLFPMILLGGLFYLLFVMPQRRRQKKLEQIRSEIAVGDDVRSVGGILGTVVDEEGDVFVLDIGGGQRMRILKRAIAEKVGGEDS